MLKGIAASPGIAIGEAYVYSKGRVNVYNSSIDQMNKDTEIKRFQDAVAASKKQLEVIYLDVLKKMGEDEAEIFKAHMMLLEDPMLQEKTYEAIRSRSINAEVALNSTLEEICGMLANLDDEYIRERAADIKDVGDRILNNLTGRNLYNPLSRLVKDVIVVSKELVPSDTAQMRADKVLGFATEMGGKTSHVAIMARSLEMPAVVGVRNIASIVNEGDILIVDGNEGIVSVNPTESELEEYKQKKAKYTAECIELEKLRSLDAVTLDGKKVELAANIGMPDDVDAALRYGAKGVGLYRTEFLYMNRDLLPSEEDQFMAYKKVAEEMRDYSVIIRTLDIGGDKGLPYIDFPEELNPFLGWRAIRLCLDRTDILKTQLRAILRASHYGKLMIMYPMITSISEIKKANSVLKEAKEELQAESLPFDENILVGIMVETPAAAIIADKLIQEVDYFSIGTNDLTQYTLAVDRGNEKISQMYQPLHPAVLRLVKYAIDTSHADGKWTGICGELAGDEKATLLLLGLGLDEFSMSAAAIPRIKKIIRSSSYEESRKIAEKALSMNTAEEVAEYLKHDSRSIRAQLN
ncbi:MAG: phosphoenolpyruvate--protein phosphotransferase [Thermacetogeniaceae bacterium]